MKYKKVAIIGAGGHTRSLMNLLEYNYFKIVGIFDDSFEISRAEFINAYPLTGKIDDFPKDVAVVLSIGDNYLRAEFFRKFKPYVVKDNLIHPKSVIEKNVILGIANQIFAYVYINSNVEICDNNIINTGAIIEHEVKIGYNNHISVNSTLCGRVRIGNNCFIGAGAVVIDKLTIQDNVTIGANSVVISDIAESGVYAGNPARRVE